MKYCGKCGTQMSDDTMLCPKCHPETNNKQPQISSQPTSSENASNVSNDNKIHIFTRIFLNHKMPIIISAIILCVVIMAIVCLRNIPYKCFDIKDDELIEIINDCGAYTSRSPLQVEGFAPDTTIYRVTYDGESGLLVLSHGLSGHIKCILICFENNDVYAAAILSSIASELDYSFSTGKAMNALLLEDESYSSNKYTAIIKDLSSELTGIFLAPKEHLEHCIKSILDN